VLVLNPDGVSVCVCVCVGVGALLVCLGMGCAEHATRFLHWSQARPQTDSSSCAWWVLVQTPAGVFGCGRIIIDDSEVFALLTGKATDDRTAVRRGKLTGNLVSEDCLLTCVVPAGVLAAAADSAVVCAVLLADVV
jgi:hypothetical protein